MANITVNQGTQSPIYTENAGTVEVGAVKIDMSAAGTYGVSMFRGTISQLNNIGTLPNLLGGTLTNLVSGTINAATAVLNSGTINVGTFVMPSGTITLLPNLPQGSINVTAGTITAGSIVVTTGTVVGNGGSMIAYGPAAAAAVAAGNPLNIGGTDSGGTIRSMLVDATGVQRSSGSMVMTVGTVTVLPNIPGGTITNLVSGTINAATAVLNSGTINVGTFVMPSGTLTVLPNLPQGSINVTAGTMRINPAPTVVLNTYGTTTSGTIGTLVAAPSAGSAIIVTSLDVNVQSGTAETVVSWGLAANGNQVLSRGNYVAGGGIAKTYANGVSGSATGTALTFNMLSGSGTVSYNLAYFVAVP